MSENNLFVLKQLIRITQKEVHHLMRTTDRLKQQNSDIAWVYSLEHSDERSEMLDAFALRYGRLQDTLGDKLLPQMLHASLEKIGTQLDNLLRAEKLGWIESVQTWIELRELRNRLIHEYIGSPDDLLAALLDALEGVKVLSEVQSRMASYIQGVEETSR